MGARLGFADVLLSKLADVPPPVAPGERTARIASPAWVHRLEPLRVAPATIFHSRYASPASAAPEPSGIPVEVVRESRRGGSTAPFADAKPVTSTPRRPVVRSPRERLAIQLLNRLGARLTAAASDEEIRTAYRRLLRESHPDLHPTADAPTVDEHSRKLRAVLRAWEVFEGRTAA
jgi:hypothetical protein